MQHSPLFLDMEVDDHGDPATRTSDPVPETSNLQTKGKQREYMTVKVGVDGHIQPAVKDVGFMILVEEMIRPAYQMNVEGTRFANIAVLYMLSPLVPGHFGFHQTRRRGAPTAPDRPYSARR